MLYKKPPLFSLQDIDASKVIVHPNYYAGALFNDVAIIILATDADTNRLVGKIRISFVY